MNGMLRKKIIVKIQIIVSLLPNWELGKIGIARDKTVTSSTVKYLVAVLRWEFKARYTLTLNQAYCITEILK